MDEDKILTQYSGKAFQAYDRVGNDLSKLPLPVQSFILVYGAQGVIDNGGYKYFFEADWPGKPDYRLFITAYEAIGCPTQAAEMARVVSTFPFANPHLYMDERNEYMDENWDDDENEIRGWGDPLCGDKTIWSRLADYCVANAKDFGLDGPEK